MCPLCTPQAPILVEQGALRAMEASLWADTAFLAGLGVMDYSLLVGVDKVRREACGVLFVRVWVGVACD